MRPLLRVAAVVLMLLFCVLSVAGVGSSPKATAPTKEPRITMSSVPLAPDEQVPDMPVLEAPEPVIDISKPSVPAMVAINPAPATTSWPSSLDPCGGDLPPCYVKDRESHGDYNAVSPDGLYRGAWQFAYGTWGGFGGYAYANEAPPDVQDAKAREVWAGGAGCGHWAAC